MGTSSSQKGAFRGGNRIKYHRQAKREPSKSLKIFAEYVSAPTVIRTVPPYFQARDEVQRGWGTNEVAVQELTQACPSNYPGLYSGMVWNIEDL